MDNGLTRREVLKGMAATAGLPYLGGGSGNLAAEAAPSAMPAGKTRPPKAACSPPRAGRSRSRFPASPGPEFAPPGKLAAPSPNAPAVYEHSQEAGPDQTFLAVGRGLTRNCSCGVVPLVESRVSSGRQKSSSPRPHPGGNPA